jgi:hypothetical protein
MFSRIEMDQPSRTDLQRHKYINHAKPSRHNSEEITSYDCVRVIFQEGGPALVSGSAWPWWLLAVFGDRARRKLNLQLQQQLIGNALFSPRWILSR